MCPPRPRTLEIERLESSENADQNVMVWRGLERERVSLCVCVCVRERVSLCVCVCFPCETKRYVGIYLFSVLLTLWPLPLKAHHVNTSWSQHSSSCSSLHHRAPNTSCSLKHEWDGEQERGGKWEFVSGVSPATVPLCGWGLCMRAGRFEVFRWEVYMNVCECVCVCTCVCERVCVCVCVCVKASACTCLSC